MQMILREDGDIEWTHSKLFRTLTTDLQKGLASLAANPPYKHSTYPVTVSR